MTAKMPEVPTTIVRSEKKADGGCVFIARIGNRDVAMVTLTPEKKYEVSVILPDSTTVRTKSFDEEFTGQHIPDPAIWLQAGGRRTSDPLDKPILFHPGGLK